MLKKNIFVLSVIVTLLVSACSPAQTPTDSPTAAPTLPAESTVVLAPTAEIASTPTTEIADDNPPTGSSTMTTFTLVPEETVVSYSVEETFLNEGNRLATAIGRTSQVTGELTVDLENPANIEFSEFSVDISTLQSDSGRRDNAIRRDWLESTQFPLARFAVKELSGFPASPQEGQPLQFKMIGDLSVREATLPVTWDVTATLNGDRLTGTATTFIMMADWGVTPPNIAGILIVKDGVTLTLDFTFTK